MRVTVNRKAHFNAAHRLHNQQWSDQKNHEVFGKCNNPKFHGHNYELIVSITGKVNAETGYVVDMKWLAELIAEKVEEHLDHKNLNEEIPAFKNTIPTAENIAIYIWKLLRPHIESAHKMEVTLYETPRNFVSFSGELL